MAEDFSDKQADKAVLPVVQEKLDVGRRQVQTGAVRVRRVDRVPVGRVVQLRPQVRQEGDTVVVPVVEERLVVRTELVLVEELRITTHREVRDATQLVSVRREEAVVERQDPATGSWKPVD